MIDNDEARKTWDGVSKAISAKLIESSKRLNELARRRQLLCAEMTDNQEAQAYFGQFRGDEIKYFGEFARLK